MIIEPIKTRIFLEWENILDFISEHIPVIHDGEILVVTSKIVALSEGRTFSPRGIEEKVEMIKQESEIYTRTAYAHLTIHDRMPMVNAWIDESNGNGKCILLPSDSYRSASLLWLWIKEKYNIANIGIIITDSHTFPFRNGTLGISLGHAGFEAIRDYRGKSDIFWRHFHYSRANVADALAIAAVHSMGEWDELQPLAIIRDSRVDFTEERQTGDALIIDPKDDLYAPLFSPEENLLD